MGHHKNTTTVPEWSPEDRHWLAGLLEGEGCFTVMTSTRKTGIYHSAKVVVSMNDREPIAKAASLLGTHVREWQGMYQAAIGARVDLDVVLPRLRPLLSPRRQAQIDRMIYLRDLTQIELHGYDDWKEENALQE